MAEQKHTRETPATHTAAMALEIRKLIKLRGPHLSDEACDEAADAAHVQVMRGGYIDDAVREAVRVATAEERPPAEYTTEYVHSAHSRAEEREEQGDHAGAGAERLRARKMESELFDVRQIPGAVEVCGDVAARGSFSGGSELPPDRFDVPLASGGELALLMYADLSNQEGADHFLEKFRRAAKGSKPPSLDQLRIAKALGRGIAAALLAGDDPGCWELVKRAHAAMFARMNKRRAVVAAIADLHGYLKRDAKMRQSRTTRKRPAHVDGPGEGPNFRAAKTLDQLIGLDASFKSDNVDIDILMKFVRSPKLAPLGIATKLSLLCGAFGDKTEPHEAKEKAYKRVKRHFEKACQELPT